MQIIGDLTIDYAANSRDDAAISQDYCTYYNGINSTQPVTEDAVVVADLVEHLAAVQVVHAQLTRHRPGYKQTITLR